MLTASIDDISNDSGVLLYIVVCVNTISLFYTIYMYYAPIGNILNEAR